MLTAEYITTETKPLTTKGTIADVKKVFGNSIFSHIPIVDNGNLFGLLAESDLPSFDDDALEINQVQDLFHSFFALEETNWVALLKLFAVNETNIIPVLNKEKKYIGYYELSDILHLFNTTPFLSESGTILILSKEKSDFSISEVTQIVETNDAKLFGIFISKWDNNKVEVTLKIYSENVNDIIHSFRRYNYDIILGINEDEYLNDLKERSDYLQKYLSI